MAQNQQTDVPQELREFAMKNITQAQAAYKQLLDAAHKAQEMMKSFVPSAAGAADMSDVEERAMRFAQQNIDAGFALAQELTKAKDLKEALQIQSRHAQLQMHAYALQAQELGALINEAAQKAKLRS